MKKLYFIFIVFSTCLFADTKEIDDNIILDCISNEYCAEILESFMTTQKFHDEIKKILKENNQEGLTINYDAQTRTLSIDNTKIKEEDKERYKFYGDSYIEYVKKTCDLFKSLPPEPHRLYSKIPNSENKMIEYCSLSKYLDNPTEN